ncbi:MAG: magnesium transporter CorA family protein [Candidatus Heimdallarchaeota archaeon]|nr:magnesium transporter CorA family protein [Candidatus Heimdallarchaeota archaeon]
MPRTLLFDENGVPFKIETKIVAKQPSNSLVWTNLRAGDDIRQILPMIVDRSMAFTEDLLEEQRPRIQTYQTLEDNDETFTVVVLSIPTEDIFKSDDFTFQVSFVLLKDQIFSVVSRESSIFSEIMSKLIAKKEQHTLTSCFKYLISELLENAISTMDQVEDFIDHSERRMLQGGVKKGWLASLLGLKGKLFDSIKLVKADIEHIRELKMGIVPEINTEEIGDHLEDRGLFLLDEVEAHREDLTNLINLHLAIASNIMNKQFYWLAIIGSILIIPTIISSIYGMNVDLPDINFWELIGLITLLTVMASFVIRYFLPKPILG